MGNQYLVLAACVLIGFLIQGRFTLPQGPRSEVQNAIPNLQSVIDDKRTNLFPSGRTKNSDPSIIEDDKRTNLFPSGRTKNSDPDLIEDDKRTNLFPSGRTKTSDLNPIEDDKRTNLFPSGRTKNSDPSIIEDDKRTNMFPSGRTKNSDPDLIEDDKRTNLFPSGRTKNSDPDLIEDDKRTNLFPSGRTKNFDHDPIEDDKRTNLFPSGRTKNSDPSMIEDDKRTNLFPSGRTKNSDPDLIEDDKRTNLFPSGRTKNSDPDLIEDDKRTNLFPSGRTKNSDPDLIEDDKRTNLFPSGRTKNSDPDLIEDNKRTNLFPSGRTKNSDPDIIEDDKRTNLFPSGRTKNSDPSMIENDKRTNLFPAGRTKSSDPSIRDTTHKDVNICFPYFISQDVNALLAQATKMLAKPINETQKSWLKLFVHRLDRLSKRLKSLPSEHKNMCFQKRQKLLSGATLQDGLLSLTPEEVELRFAKQIFDVHDKPQLPRTQPKEYVIGTVFSKFVSPRIKNFDGPRKYLAPSHTQNAKTDKLNHTTNSINQAQSSEESMPFPPRVTRKSIPWQILERLKFHNQNGDGESAADSSGAEEPQAQERQSDDTRSSSSDRSTQNHEGVDVGRTDRMLRHFQQEETLIGVQTRTTAAESVTDSLQNPTKYSSNNYEDDDVVMQLHAGVANTQGIGPIATQEPSSHTVAEDLEPMGTQDKTEITESATKEVLPDEEREELIRMQNQRPDVHELLDESDAYPRQLPIANSQDFDYEEQGAAAGELYIDEENLPFRQLAVPTSLGSILTSSHVDDAVQQLRALKEPSSTEPPKPFNQILNNLDLTPENSGSVPEHSPRAPELSASPPENTSSTPDNLVTVPDRVYVRLAGPAGRVHRSHRIHVDDKK